MNEASPFGVLRSLLSEDFIKKEQKNENGKHHALQVLKEEFFMNERHLVFVQSVFKFILEEDDSDTDIDRVEAFLSKESVRQGFNIIKRECRLFQLYRNMSQYTSDRFVHISGRNTIKIYSNYEFLRFLLIQSIEDESFSIRTYIKTVLETLEYQNSIWYLACMEMTLGEIFAELQTLRAEDVGKIRIYIEYLYAFEYVAKDFVTLIINLTSGIPISEKIKVPEKGLTSEIPFSLLVRRFDHPGDRYGFLLDRSRESGTQIEANALEVFSQLESIYTGNFLVLSTGSQFLDIHLQTDFVLQVVNNGEVRFYGVDVKRSMVTGFRFRQERKSFDGYQSFIFTPTRGSDTFRGHIEILDSAVYIARYLGLDTDIFYKYIMKVYPGLYTQIEQ